MASPRSPLLFAALGLALFLLAMARPLPCRADDRSGYPRIEGPCGLSFPRDHGPHPDHGTEWWYWTGSLATAEGRRFGFQLTFFRHRLVPPGQTDVPEPASPWRTEQLYLAHAHVADIDGMGKARFHHAEEAARGARGLAGATLDGGAVELFLKDWSARMEPGDSGSGPQTLHVSASDFGLDLALAPAKPPVLHGWEGYSPKGSRPESASCYYSITRLEGSGTLRLGRESFTVQGEAWMDHEFSSASLEPGLAGWDWFGLRLSDGSEVMAYFLRQVDGSPGPASGGTLVDPAGNVVHIPADGLRLEVLDHWRSPSSGARYPSRWRLAVPSLGLTVLVSPDLADQEMRTPMSTSVTYWEGSVSVMGEAGGRHVKGRGYVELTGYASPLAGRF